MFNLNLEQQRKRAKDLRRGHQDKELDAAIRVARYLPRARNQSPEEVLASPLTLSEAQYVIAREAGFASWPKLKHYIDENALHSLDTEEAAITAAFAGRDDVRPSPVRSIYVAAALADADAAMALLASDSSQADRRGGLRDWTPLLYLCCSRYRRENPAAMQDRLRIAKRLIDLGADINARGLELGYTAPSVNQMFDEHEWHPIEGAVARLVCPQLVRLLIDAGVDFNKTTEVVSQAVRAGNEEILEMVLKAGPEGWWQIGWALKACAVLDRPEFIPILLRYRKGSLPPERPFLEALRLERRRDVYVALLGDEKASVDMRVIRRMYRAAVRYDQREAMDLLRQRGASDADLSDVDRVIGAAMSGERIEDNSSSANLSPKEHRFLPWAVRNKRYRAVPRLLEVGLDPNVPDVDGETSLHLAVRDGAVGVVDVLLKSGTNMNACNFDSETPLDIALAQKNSETRDRVMTSLLEAGAKPAQAEPAMDREEMPILFERAADAVASGDEEQLRELLDEEPFLVHARSPRPHRATLLHYCGANGVENWRQRTPPNAAAITKLLLDRGADPDATCNLYGGGSTMLGLMLTSAHPLREGLQKALLEVMLNAGATFEGTRGTEGIVGAAALGRLDLVQQLAATSSQAKIESAFLRACEYGRTDVVKYLVNNGVNVHFQNGEGQTGLHLGAVHGHLEIVKLLLEYHPNLEVTNVWGGTVLGTTFWGLMNGNPKTDYGPVIELLIKSGAIVDPELREWWQQEIRIPPDKRARIDAALNSASA